MIYAIAQGFYRGDKPCLLVFQLMGFGPKLGQYLQRLNRSRRETVALIEYFIKKLPNFTLTTLNTALHCFSIPVGINSEITTVSDGYRYRASCCMYVRIAKNRTPRPHPAG